MKSLKRFGLASILKLTEMSSEFTASKTWQSNQMNSAIAKHANLLVLNHKRCVVGSSLWAFPVHPNFEPVCQLHIWVNDHALVISLLRAIAERLFSRVKLLFFNALLLKEERLVVLRVFHLLCQKTVKVRSAVSILGSTRDFCDSHIL